MKAKLLTACGCKKIMQVKEPAPEIILIAIHQGVTAGGTCVDTSSSVKMYARKFKLYQFSNANSHKKAWTYSDLSTLQVKVELMAEYREVLE